MGTRVGGTHTTTSKIAPKINKNGQKTGKWPKMGAILATFP